MKTRMALLVAALSILVACGGSAEPAKKKAPDPPKVYTAAQLEAAMPADKDIPDLKEVYSRCPGTKDCPAPEDGIQSWSVAWEPKTPLKGVEAERASNANWVGDFANLSVEQTTTQAATAKNHAKYLKQETEKEGSFEVKVNDLGDRRFNPGEKGTGKVEAITIKDWSGFASEKSLENFDLDGKSSGPREQVLVEVTKGKESVQATLAIALEGRKPGDALNLARSVIEDYLDRLEAK